VDAEQLRCCLFTHDLRDGRPPVAALCHEPGIFEALHQYYPGPYDADGIPAGGGRLGREPVSRSGHLVAFIRLRNSVSSASGKVTWNSRMAVLSLPACWAPSVMAVPSSFPPAGKTRVVPGTTLMSRLRPGSHWRRVTAPVMVPGRYPSFGT